jgi:hypothetical protein
VKPEISSDTTARVWQTKYATHKFLDLTGRRFGRLVTVGHEWEVVDSGRRRLTRWKCVCDCGTERSIRQRSLIAGITLSCGCFGHEQRIKGIKAHAPHGKTNTRAHKAWMEMNRRCHDPKRKAYPDYGGRGISICERWKDFRNFLEDMGECPDGLTLDRKDTNGNYEPENCRWVTYKVQNNNRRSNRLLEWNGECKTMTAWSEITGIKVGTLWQRLEFGWTIDRALTHPVRPLGIAKGSTCRINTSACQPPT